ncbi:MULTISPECIES: hypothetical protein [unclassified Leeuwenhoekiella]|uniref:hypothetical protein n=1 Tax=unclassified Leeuwenhoekiella TaxID=2615029 RepID=UPI000C45B629|nr:MULTISPECIES: hypothetical protein [unclassified Leeuwenhoekiella]MAW94408.1 hypothetical protein [Leeuwenhoekiella sp.]MBA81085.1 hypothetical protein [Leeuwenhoekiella sp.]|tara:strand:- start:22031 stop:22606 length:576 start_codon:yes stop_codon:yes gene_type:complete
MTQNLLFILVVGIGLFFAVKYAAKAKKDIVKHQQAEKQTEQNPYFDMRKMAFSVTAEQLGLSGIDKNDVYGIVSEMDMNGGTATVVTFSTGDTSIYLSSGGAFIGAGQYESVQEVVKKYVKNGQKYIEKATKIEKAKLPKNGMTNFNFLTENGIYSISENLSELESGKSEFSNLFIELNEVISQIRMKSGE